MNRRDFLKVVSLSSAAMTIPGLAPVQARAARGPNLLILHTDQLSCWALSAYAGHLTRTPNYGKILVQTPHIDSLAKEGAILYNFFTNSAVCTPSRGCLVSGRYPHAHGAYRNDIEMNRDQVTIARILQDNGYDAGYSGKWHLDGPPKPGWMTPDRSMGFADCRYMFNRGHWKKIEDQPDGTAKVSPYNVIGDEKTYTTDWLAGKMIEFIQKPRMKPFFYMVSFPDPHTPFTVREPYMSMYDPQDMVVPKTLTGSPAKTRKAAGNSEEAMRKSKAHYCGLVKCIDDNIGHILAVLKDKGTLDDTVIVLTTDHGEYMGEHGLYGKNQWYRTAYQIPFLVRWPSKIRAGTEIERFVTNVDVQQTLLGLMGIAPCGREQGRDASPLLRGQNVEWKDEAMIHHSSLESAGIFTPQYELVLKSDGSHMLFSRLNDPEQTTNLRDDPQYAGVMRELAQRVIRHNIEVDSPAVSWLKVQGAKLGVERLG